MLFFIARGIESKSKEVMLDIFKIQQLYSSGHHITISQPIKFFLYRVDYKLK